MNYYNDNDAACCRWLRALIDAGLIPPGDVDDRSIADIRPQDLDGYTQCHFFAGIAGWSEALRLADWPADREVWTGSCPCQPFSAAGKRKGTDDERHLWPELLRLMRECRPTVIMGEQVASAEVVGTQLEAAFLVAVQEGRFARANKLAKRLAQSKSFHYHRRWVDGIQADLEAAGYSFRYGVLGAHSVGAPHIRQRLYWVADAEHERARAGVAGEQGQAGGGRDRFADDGQARGLADAGCLQGRGNESWRGQEGRAADWRLGAWSDYRIIPCGDGRSRRVPVEPAFFPLAARIPGRVAQLRGLGNAIVPQVAAEFIRAYLETLQERKTR